MKIADIITEMVGANIKDEFVGCLLMYFMWVVGSYHTSNATNCGYLVDNFNGRHQNT